MHVCTHVVLIQLDDALEVVLCCRVVLLLHQKLGQSEVSTDIGVVDCDRLLVVVLGSGGVAMMDVVQSTNVLVRTSTLGIYRRKPGS